jgi:phospholipase C
VPPGPVPPPDPDAPAGELGFTFDRSGYRVPAILVSPWVPKGSVFNDEYRHTSLIATLRKTWNLGEAFTQRDASARTFDDLFTLDRPRDPETWATFTALPVPAWHLDEEALGNGLSGLGKNMGHGLIEHARELGLELPPQLQDPAAEPTPHDIIQVFRQVAGHYFPLLTPHSTAAGHQAGS